MATALQVLPDVYRKRLPPERLVEPQPQDGVPPVAPRLLSPCPQGKPVPLAPQNTRPAKDAVDEHSATVL
jgi:hypothetical protein